MTYNEKNKLQKDLLIRGSLEIKKNDSTRRGYNDPQLTVKSNAWDPLMKRLPKQPMEGHKEQSLNEIDADRNENIHIINFTHLQYHIT